MKAPDMRLQHLKQCIKLAQEREDEDLAAAILRMLHREAQNKMLAWSASDNSIEAWKDMHDSPR